MPTHTQNLETHVKRVITVFRRLDGSKRRLSALDISVRMQRLVDNIAEVAEVSADDAFALCCSLLCTEGHVHGQVDDSSGRISRVYRGSLMSLVRTIAHRCRNEKLLLAALLQACSHDELGTVCLFIDIVAPILPEHVVRTVMSDIALRPLQQREPSTFHYDANVEMLKRFYVALGDTENYIALCERTSNFHVHDLLTISEMYCDHEEYAKAEGWLGKISQENRAVTAEREALMVRILTMSGRHDEIAQIMRAAFLASPSADSFATFEARCGRDAAEVLEREFLAMICEAAEPSMDAISFLVQRRHVAEMTSVLIAMQRPVHFDYYLLSSIATNLYRQRAWLGTVVAHRMLVDDILAHSRKGAYYIGAHYMRCLERYSRNVIDWQSVIRHEAYVASLHATHHRKTSFWSNVVESQ